MLFLIVPVTLTWNNCIEQRVGGQGGNTISNSQKFSRYRNIVSCEVYMRSQLRVKKKVIEVFLQILFKSFVSVLAIYI